MKKKDINHFEIIFPTTPCVLHDPAVFSLQMYPL